MIIREHQYADGKCLHCGDHTGVTDGNGTPRACIAREMPRAVPTSIFAGDITSIGERLKEIKAEQVAAVSAAIAADNPDAWAALTIEEQIGNKAVGDIASDIWKRRRDYRILDAARRAAFDENWNRAVAALNRKRAITDSHL